MSVKWKQLLWLELGKTWVLLNFINFDSEHPYVAFYWKKMSKYDCPITQHACTNTWLCFTKSLNLLLLLMFVKLTAQNY